MYATKQARQYKEKHPDADVYIFYMDIRAFGKGYEEFYERIKEEGVNIIRGRTAKIEQLNGQLMLRSENILEDKINEQKVDMAILAVGLEPSVDTEKISKMLNIPRGNDGWFKEAGSVDEPTDTYNPGIFLAGTCQGPKDIPDTVAQASAAASSVLKSITGKTVKQSINELRLEEIESKIFQD